MFTNKVQAVWKNVTVTVFPEKLKFVNVTK